MQQPAIKELWIILRLAGPLIASQMAHMLMVFTDTVMMGKIGPEALAGGGLGAASYNLISFFCVGVMAAVGTLVAIRHGAGDNKGATQLVQAGVWLDGIHRRFCQWRSGLCLYRRLDDGHDQGRQHVGPVGRGPVAENAGCRRCDPCFEPWWFQLVRAVVVGGKG